MIEFFTRLLPRPEPKLSEATPRDAAAFAALHVKAFPRGWSETEFEQLLTERNVVADRAVSGDTLAGFVLSRRAADQAEILSMAVADAWRRRGIGRKLIDIHLRRLAALRVISLFLEVDEDNAPARRLYARSGFREVGRRAAYYPQAHGRASAALVLRRDLA